MNYRRVYQMGGRPMQKGPMSRPQQVQRKTLSPQEMFNRIVEKLMQEEGLSREEAERTANDMMSKQNLSNQKMSNQKMKDGGKTKKKKRKKKSTPKYKDGGSVFGIQNGGRSPFS
tara:strand:+ start:239 stop:583 length:345 start_codon:yes stop_codon:yes gene_type:complete